LLNFKPEITPLPIPTNFAPLPFECSLLVCHL